MPGLILHVGAQKTGSSALQRFFTANRDLLSRAGCAYPQLPFPERSLRDSNAEVLARACASLAKDGDDPSNWRSYLGPEYLSAFEDALEGHGRILVSEEMLWMSVRGIGLDRREGIREHALIWQTLAHIFEHLGIDDLHIIVYLRRQDEFLSSLWRETVRNGRHAIGFHAWEQQLRSGIVCDYRERIRIIEAALPTCRITVRSYGQPAFGKDLFHDFCEAASIPWNDAFSLPGRVNASLPFDVADGMRPLLVAFPSGYERFTTLAPIAEELGRTVPDAPGTTPYSPEKRRELKEAFADGNDWISKRFPSCSRAFEGDWDEDRPQWTENRKRSAKYTLTLLRMMLERHPLLATKALARVLFRTHGRLSR